MVKEILKTVLAGILGGIALFLLPFFVWRIILFFVIVKLIFRLLRGKNYWRGYRYACAGKFHSMSEEERKAYMEKYNHCCHNWEHCEETKTTETKTKENE